MKKLSLLLMLAVCIFSLSMLRHESAPLMQAIVYYDDLHSKQFYVINDSAELKKLSPIFDEETHHLDLLVNAYDIGHTCFIELKYKNIIKQYSIYGGNESFGPGFKIYSKVSSDAWKISDDESDLLAFYCSKAASISK